MRQKGRVKGVGSMLKMLVVFTLCVALPAVVLAGTDEVGLLNLLQDEDLTDAQRAKLEHLFIRGMTAEELQEVKEDKAASDFKGLGFSAAIGVAFFFEDDASVDAEIVNDIVRVKEERKVVPRLMLDSHYFFALDDDSMRGCGPFFGVLSSDDKFIGAVAVGLMSGFRRAKDKPESFNLGIGVIWQPETQVLGSGFTPDKAPPEGETEIRYETKSSTGLVLMASFSF